MVMKSESVTGAKVARDGMSKKAKQTQYRVCSVESALGNRCRKYFHAFVDCCISKSRYKYLSHGGRGLKLPFCYDHLFISNSVRK